MKQIKIIIVLQILMLIPNLVSADIVLRSVPNNSQTQNRYYGLQQSQPTTMPNPQFMETVKPYDFDAYQPFDDQPITQYVIGGSHGPGNGGGAPPTEGMPLGDVVWPLLLFAGIYWLKLKTKNLKGNKA